MWVQQEVCVHTSLRVHMLGLRVKCVCVNGVGVCGTDWFVDWPPSLVLVSFPGRLRLTSCGWSLFPGPQI